MSMQSSILDIISIAGTLFFTSCMCTREHEAKQPHQVCDDTNKTRAAVRNIVSRSVTRVAGLVRERNSAPAPARSLHTVNTMRGRKHRKAVLDVWNCPSKGLLQLYSRQKSAAPTCRDNINDLESVEICHQVLYAYSPTVPAITSPCTPHSTPNANIIHPIRTTPAAPTRYSHQIYGQPS
jgi:hypothetical protein